MVILLKHSTTNCDQANLTVNTSDTEVPETVIQSEICPQGKGFHLRTQIPAHSEPEERLAILLPLTAWGREGELGRIFGMRSG